MSLKKSELKHSVDYSRYKTVLDTSGLKLLRKKNRAVRIVPAASAQRSMYWDFAVMSILQDKGFENTPKVHNFNSFVHPKEGRIEMLEHEWVDGILLSDWLKGDRSLDEMLNLHTTLKKVLWKFYRAGFEHLEFSWDGFMKLGDGTIYIVDFSGVHNIDVTKTYFENSTPFKFLNNFKEQIEAGYANK